jgi:hypothetical protein
MYDSSELSLDWDLIFVTESVYYCSNKAYNQLRTFEALPQEGSKNHDIMSLGLDSYITNRKFVILSFNHMVWLDWTIRLQSSL